MPVEAACVACGNHLKPGDRYYTDGRSEYVHASCAALEWDCMMVHDDQRGLRPLHEGEPMPEPAVYGSFSRGEADG